VRESTCGAQGRLGEEGGGGRFVKGLQRGGDPLRPFVVPPRNRQHSVPCGEKAFLPSWLGPKAAIDMP